VEPDFLVEGDSLPGGTTTPFRRCVASVMLARFGGEAPRERRPGHFDWAVDLEFGGVVLRNVGLRHRDRQIDRALVVTACGDHQIDGFVDVEVGAVLARAQHETTPPCRRSERFSGFLSTSSAELRDHVSPDRD